MPGSDRTVTFGGKTTITIPNGGTAVSDAVIMDIPALADLAVSVFVPKETGPLTQHNTALRTTYIVSGDATGQPVIAEPRTTNTWYWLSGVDVLAPANAFAAVAFGDSITDGATSTPNTDHSWPSLLAARLVKAGITNVAVINEGIGGNRLFRDGAGLNASARFDRDVLAKPGVKWVALMEGINDLGNGNRPNAAPADAVTGEMVIASYQQMIERAHILGLKVIGCTLTPFEGAGYYTEKAEAGRKMANQWIRSSGAFDAVFDFDKATQDPAHPLAFLPANNNTDKLHPNDAGYQAMADSVDLTLFGSAAKK